MRTDRKIRKHPHCRGRGRIASGVHWGEVAGQQGQVTKVLECHGRIIEL